MRSAKSCQSPEKNLAEGVVPSCCGCDVFSITLGIVAALMTDAFCKTYEQLCKGCDRTLKFELYKVYIPVKVLQRYTFYFKLSVYNVFETQFSTLSVL